MSGYIDELRNLFGSSAPFTIEGAAKACGKSKTSVRKALSREEKMDWSAE